LNELLKLIPLLYATIALAYTGFLDFKSREVDPKLWLIFLVPGIPISILFNYYLGDTILSLLSLTLSIPIVALTYIMYRLCMIGGADVLALAFISIIAPYTPGSILPTLYATILYSITPALFYQLYSNMKVCRVTSIKCMLSLKHSIEAERLLKDPSFKWWLIDYSGGCSIDEDKETIIAKASGGNLKTILQASPGHPYVAHLSIGLILAIILRDYPIKILIEALLL